MSLASRASIALAFTCLVPASAFAGPTVGASVGESESQAYSTYIDGAANTTVGLFVRGRVNRILSLQGEVSKQDGGYSSYTAIRTWNAAAIFDLANGGFVPFLLVGVGADVVSGMSTAGEDSTYEHVEIGGGLEYRFRGGLVVGADARIGDRNTPATEAYDTPVAQPGSTGVVHLIVPSSGITPGQYRSVRLTLGVHF